jgi:single-stranded DNA-binding protein
MAQVKITGHLGQDPETGKTKNGNEMSKLRVAESNDYYDEATKAWIKREPTWWFVTGFTNTVRKAMSELKKGSKVSIEARIEKTEENVDGSWNTKVYVNAYKVSEILPEA